MDDDYDVVLAEREGWVDWNATKLRGAMVIWPEQEYLWVDNVAIAPSAQGVGLGASSFASPRSELGRPGSGNCAS